MASSFTILILLLVSNGVFAGVQAQKQYKVGGNEGWRTPPENSPDLYAAWASNIHFHAGDSILFEYKNDSVVRVDKRGYYHCNESSGHGSGVSMKDGSTVFLFDRPGTYYFVSGDLQHCKNGQRLMVAVMAPHEPPFSGAPGPSPVLSTATIISGDSLVAPVLAAITSAFLLKWDLKPFRCGINFSK